MTLNITDLAKLKIQSFMKNSPDKVFRVSVSSGGCSGFSYKTELDVQKPDDLLIDVSGSAQVAVDSISQPFLKSTTLDYIDSIGFSGFKFENLDASSTCGCGSSFDV